MLQNRHKTMSFSFVSISSGQCGPGFTPLLFRRRRKCEDNIKMDFKELGYEGVSLIGLAQDRDKWRALVKRVTSTQVP